jgi:branched-chain amino acid transport system permease protein
VFLMKVLCFALFACAFNLLLGLAGCCPSATPPISAPAAMSPAHAAKVWGLTPELAILAGTLARGAGAVFGALAIRRRASTSPW